MATLAQVCSRISSAALVCRQEAAVRRERAGQLDPSTEARHLLLCQAKVIDAKATAYERALTMLDEVTP